MTKVLITTIEAMDTEEISKMSIIDAAPKALAAVEACQNLIAECDVFDITMIDTLRELRRILMDKDLIDTIKKIR